MFKLEISRDRSTASTLVDQIVERVSAAIEQHALREGTRMPSVRTMAKSNELSAFTVSEAYQRLVSMGLLTSRPGSGYRVARRNQTAESDVTVPKPPSLNAAWLLSDVFADASVPIKAGCGWVPEAWINESGLQHGLRALSRLPGPRLGGYGHPRGMTALRELVAANLRRYGLNVDMSQVLLTEGATQAIDLVVRTLLRPGDVVVVEDPCYCNLLQILKLAGLHVVAVRRTLDGVDLSELETVFETYRPKALFINTVLQNPTGASFSIATAFRTLQIADRHGCWVIEDDICRELADPLSPCLAAMEGFQRVIYVSGFSKTISPKLRCGYVIAEHKLLLDLARTKMAVGLTSCELSERLVANMLIEGHYERYTQFLREKLKEAHSRMHEGFSRLGIATFAQPHAGLFLWAELPVEPARAEAVATQALSRGIWLAPGSYFAEHETPSSWFRFNVATSDAPELWDFLSSEK
jgi:DNA-binding transcriptional MocR family regulator